MNANDLKLRAWAWIQAHVEPGMEFRTVRLRKGLRLTSDAMRARLSYVLRMLVVEGRLTRLERRKQTYRLASRVVMMEAVQVQTLPFRQLLAFIIGYLMSEELKYVRTTDLHHAIAGRFDGSERLLRHKGAWAQSYDWAMHRLKCRGWIWSWGKARIEVSRSMYVDLYRRGDYETVATWLDRWWREYEAVQLRPSREPNLLDAL